MRFFSRLATKFRQFMLGRRGLDSFGIVLLALYLTASFCLNFFMHNRIAWYICEAIAFSFLLWFILRFVSRNIARREREDRFVKNLFSRIKRAFTSLKRKWRDRKTHVYFKCPACKNTLRVPKGRGNITVTCPVCRESIKKRT